MFKLNKITEKDVYIDQFIEKVDFTNTCWQWQGLRNFKGYGLFKKFRAHRLSYFYFKDRKFDQSKLILHKCDNPPCVNPRHLFVGTPMDNMLDKIRKGRENIPKGFDRKNITINKEKFIKIKDYYLNNEVGLRDVGRKFNLDHKAISVVFKRHGIIIRKKGNKLTPNMIKKIREKKESGETSKKIAKDFSISTVMVNKICSNKAWKCNQVGGTTAFAVLSLEGR